MNKRASSLGQGFMNGLYFIIFVQYPNSSGDSRLRFPFSSSPLPLISMSLYCRSLARPPSSFISATVVHPTIDLSVLALHPLLLIANPVPGCYLGIVSLYWFHCLASQWGGFPSQQFITTTCLDPVVSTNRKGRFTGRDDRILGYLAS
ncbi:hypothetical protein R3P38DRAFT_3181237 [Favolaschia claudopus]|uniref:Uncharacterized protein n=1 Tax=Favolaschia claudopus TaxID=2862362 RepID=A0AAW0CM15_9AGAR